MRERESEKEELREKRRRESQRGWSFELSTSSMDPDSAQNGVSKKMGLARLAKARSISNSLNNLQFIDDNPEVVLTTPTQSPPSPLNLPSLPNDTLRAQEQHTEAQGSPLRSFNRQGAGVNLLPNKMNVSTLSGQPAEKKNKGTSPDDDVVSIDSSHGQVPCSDPDFIKGGKSGMKGSPSQQKIAAEVDKQSVKSDSMNSSDSPGKKSESSSGSSGFYSPMLARRSRLEPPKVKRSRSLTRLTEAINQIHNLCVFPAQPAVAPENQKGSSPPSSPSHQPVSLHLSAPEMRSGRAVVWDSYKPMSEDHTSISSSDDREDEITKDSPRHDYRSASLDELTNIGVPVGLPILSPGDLKHKNYLFGGFSSLLGASELDRYIPKRSITIFIATWNMNGKEPPQNLEDFLLPEALEQVPDMYVVGTQESGGSRSEWEVRLQAAIGPSHCLFTSAIFGVLHLVIFLRRDLLWFCSVPEEATYSLRPGVAYKTKGGVGIGFQFFGTRMLFINSHLTAHEEKQQYRIQNFRNICHSLDIPRLLPHKFKNKDVTHRYDCVFWLGDLNFRLAVNREHVFERLKQPGLEAYQHLLQWDQLSQAQQKGEAFTEFTEGTITFPPTFKYDPGTDHYDTSSKQRVPSYTDRILFKSGRGAITCSSYNYCPLFRTSDHKPVSGVYECKIRPGKDDVPLAAGMFNRDVYLEALRRRRRFLYQPSLKNCPVQ
ncbi:inositol polyphosphate 5-phosphatase E-like isoform X3 [Penaeus japonicus]|uniref:inositol polyphosphate 5-phosphatase E-like isoform X3 n=1 Tax=Penaeus japonicus TaxID=27405 RepID=UPI001C70C2BD|nr:inositol polyphosphate 5-phosphatase E-like isoform X3 [Penaeus japonicus]